MLGTVDFEARCMAAQTLRQLGGASIEIISKAEYDSIEHDSKTIYYVQEDGKVVQYLGDVKLTSGAIAGSGSLSGLALTSIVGSAEYESLAPEAEEEPEENEVSEEAE